jgi:aspartyl protease family protein
MLFWPILIIAVVVAAVFFASAPEAVGLAGPDEGMRAAFLAALLAFLLGGGVGRMMLRGGWRTLRNALAWVAIFAVVLGGYALRGDAAYLFDRIRGELMPSMALSHAPGEVELRRAWDGHYRADARVNGHAIRMMVDTGASMVLIPYEEARALGIDPELLSYSMPVSTANGRSSVAPVRLSSVQVGPIVVRDVAAAVAHPGRLSSPLLGMSFIERLSETTFRGDRLILRQYAGDTPGSVILTGGF